MKNFENLVTAAKRKGFKFEAFSTKFDRWGDQITEQTYLQIQIGKSVWYTWMSFKDDDYLFFEGRYNQNNGAHQKTFRKEFKALNILGIEIS